MGTLSIIILFLGLINIIRNCLLFFGSCWYDLSRFLKRNKSTQLSSPWITVIITAFNEEKVIHRCLTSVYESTYPKLNVVIANDGSTDQTLSIANAFKNNLSPERSRSLRIITTPNGGKARILNHVLKKYVKTPLIMVLDADSLIEPNAIENAVKYFNDINVVAVASNVRIIKQPNLLCLIQYIEYVLGHHMKKAYTSANNEYIIGGIGSTFRYSILRKVDFFDTNTMTEDIDLSMKILNRGNKKHKVIFGSDVVCYTEYVNSLYGLFRQRFRWKYGRLQTLYKQKHLFFNPRSKYTKLFTFVQLPFVIYSELSFLFDPLFIGLIFYFLIKYQDVQTIGSIFLFFAAFTAGSILADEYSSWGEKLTLLLLCPLAYLFFFILSIVEYFTLLKCVINIPQILKTKDSDHCSWVPVQRIG